MCDIEQSQAESGNFEKAMDIAKQFEGGLTKEMEAGAEKFDRERVERADEGIVRNKGGVLLVNSDIKGCFDLWYKKAPVVVVFNSLLKTISIGATDTKKAEELFGPGGLKNVFPKLDGAWGGRESIGGSPRGKEMAFSDAEKAYDTVSGMMKTKKASPDWVGTFLES